MSWNPHAAFTGPTYDPEKHRERLLALLSLYPLKHKDDSDPYIMRVLIEIHRETNCTIEYLTACHLLIEGVFLDDSYIIPTIAPANVKSVLDEYDTLLNTNR